MVGKKLVIGILAHVDAGKTTLAENILYMSGSIRKAGRVDHRDTFLDTDSQERTRGITIFSKQAEFSWKGMDATLLDTPGHVDFSAEMERTLQVLDYAVLVVSGADGIQGHVMTLWNLLARYRIPVFLFVNKMDQPGTDRESLMRELQERLSGQCVDFTADAARGGDYEQFLENVAVCDEKLLEKYLDQGTLDEEETAALIAGRKVFPCYFGSALKAEGVKELLDGVEKFGLARKYPDSFGARVYKIGRDSAGSRLTYMKITGGCLRVKQSLKGSADEWEEKVDQIRIYSGVKYTLEKEVPAGAVCVVTGLSRTFSGEGLGMERGSVTPVLAPVMTYRVVWPSSCDTHVMYKKLCQLEEEEPQLHIIWKEQLGEIHVQLMGEVQIEILKNLIGERFGIPVEFDEGSIVYKETIRRTAEGVGHFEPLRHYAEVHLLMEPGEAGSGLVFDTNCSEDVLDKNWQRLILTHLEEKEHPGILTGAPITDMKITLVSGRAHLKHTEGGDFRQATYRAVRQGLHRAESVLLEPVYAFRLELPSALIGRAMTDVQAMCGHFDAPVTEGDRAVLTGTAPAAGMQGYQAEVTAYSGGNGRLFCSLKGYEPCHNAEEIIARVGYDAERDPDNPASSVFCAHGAGFLVGWQDVEQYMHLESCLNRKDSPKEGGGQQAGAEGRAGTEDSARKESGGQDAGGYAAYAAGEKELEEIFNRTYGSRDTSGSRASGKNRSGLGGLDRRRKWGGPKTISAESSGTDGAGNPLSGAAKQSAAGKAPAAQEEYLLVDGYNIIFAWEELRELAEINLDSARGKLMDILSNYQGYRKMTLILVFDAYKVKGSPGSIFLYHNIHVVYTKEAETADQYIEKVTHEIARKHRVSVATSDGLEQLIIMGQGAKRLSARELKEDIMSTNQELRELFLEKGTKEKQYLFDALPPALAEHMEDVRLGKKGL
ncbi:MAG: TetM/TetW/TetO/TetS family tetracycline resistance ribosomal protection protein [Blautia sp.]|nr:TetM/TetW/TetO/TetS family tetracycline resistance ribosomal protection protein [Blautia sp.]MCM1200281.1 TetM/TetW/TetO/TetS family tetracycline resistance ribosomal protection protein [Bacteroides fragilis]